MSADIIQVGPVRQRVLSNQITVTAIEIWITRLATSRNEALAENHVGRAKAPRIRPPENNRITRHFRVNELGLSWVFRHFFPKLGIVSQFAIRPVKWRREHVMTK